MVIALAVLSVDGKIALTPEDNTSWSSREDKHLFARITKKAGVVILGRRTFETLKKNLPGRQLVVLTRNPQAAQKNLGQYQGITYTNEDPDKLIKILVGEGYRDIIVAGGREIYTLFFTHKLINQVWVTIEPYLFGDQSVNFLADLSQPSIQLKLLDSHALNPNSVHLRYQVLYHEN